MSLHYSKHQLNTYWGTEYFRAHAPEAYPVEMVAQKCRAFRRLPPRLRELAETSKRWARKNRPDALVDIKLWYDDEGYELNPATGQRLTDAEIDAEWGAPSPTIANFRVVDIPATHLSDPDSWQPPPEPEEDTGDDGDFTKDQLLSWIRSHGRARVIEDFGNGMDQASAASLTDEELAERISERRKSA